MKRHIVFLIALASAGALFLGTAPPSSSTTIALVSKVIADVTRKAAGKDWQPALRGEMLTSGESIRTGEKSFAIIKFKDNSMLRLRERTEVMLGGMQEGKAFLKSTEMRNGVIGFSIRKQQPGEEFRFSSPTSVASIRGTSGLYSAADSSDKLIVLEGLVKFSNKISTESADVEGGYTGISSPDGKILVRPSTREEKVAAQLASRTGEQDNQLEIELNDGSGSKKNIDIRFK